MKRGDLYLVNHGSKDDPKKQRVYLVVSRQAAIYASFSTVICAPIYTRIEAVNAALRIALATG